ncbi:MAG: hypothetical protein HKL82_03305 [Acidimicrobiaceae bacterium]|nr:hypothetical protein [Acidimicrobiaceae bacterium]
MDPNRTSDELSVGMMYSDSVADQLVMENSNNATGLSSSSDLRGNGHGVIDLTKGDVAGRPGTLITDMPVAEQAKSEPTVEPVRAPATGVHRKRRHYLAILLTLAIAGALAPEAWYYINSLNNSTFPAQISSFGLVPVNFLESGTISQIEVKPGQVVTASSVLATESSSTADALVARDKAQLVADQQHLTQLQSLGTSAANGSASALDQQVSAARIALNSASTDYAAALSKAQQNVSFDQSEVSNEQSEYAAQCPSGTTAAGPNLTIAECISLNDALQVSQQNLGAAEELVLSIQASEQLAVSQAQRQLTDAQSSLQLPVIGNSASYQSSSDVYSAQLEILKDKAQLAADQQSAGSLVLVAGISGTVVQVNGTVGMPVGSSGVQTVTGQGNSVPAAPSFQLFPTSGLQQVNSSSSQPLVVIKTHLPMRAVALLPESDLGKVHLGSQVKFTPSISGLNSINMRVTSIGAFPVISEGSASYAISLAPMNATPRGYLQGMTGTVKLT